MRHAAPAYIPPLWLRNGHLQSVLSSSRLRQRRGQALLDRLGARHQELLLDGGNGCVLQAWHSQLPSTAPRALALLLHGWEGSAESGYMRMAAAQLLAAGFAVVRLNFRDHGNTHHLNQGLFHSARIDEVVHAAAELATRHPGLPMVAAGYSLGGNFALRLALRAPAAGIALAHVAAVCPVLDPARTMDRLEQGTAVYSRYFHRKWTASLRRKRALYPELMDGCDDAVLSQDLRALTAWLVQRHAGFQDVQAYFQAYSVAGQRIAALQVPSSVLMAADDPVIPVDGFHQWPLPAHSQLHISPWGGHCGFIENLRGDGWSERWLRQVLAPAVGLTA